MDVTFYDGHDELYHHAKFGEDRTTLAGVTIWNPPPQYIAPGEIDSPDGEIWANIDLPARRKNRPSSRNEFAP